jgi:hypothetical protein
MDDHSHFVELAALAAGGHLSDEEAKELDGHLQTCADCKDATAEFRELVRFRLPLSQSRLRQYIERIMTRPDAGARERFIRRASLEGIRFSPDVKKMTSSRGPALRFAAAGVGVVVAVLVVASLYGLQHPGRSPQRFDPVLTQQQNTVLRAKISQLEQSLAGQQRENESMRAQVATLAVAANNPHRNNEQTGAETTQSASHSAQSLEEFEEQRKIQEKLLADTRAKLTRLNRARVSDQASLVAEQIHINELSEQLKNAKANTNNVQRQLMTAGGDVPNLMGARQLHVVDVRDTDPDGKPGKAFGRIFLTEGKSLVFYAFDLNDSAKNDKKKTFQVWGQQEGNANSLRSLGFLNVDNKAQRRWALKTNDVAAFNQINSIFVTVEPPGGAESPGGKRLLFASLGGANHP